MTEEAYINYDTAKLLNEKGFKIDTTQSYWIISPDGIRYHMSPIGAYTSDINDKSAFYRPADSYPCITQQVAMRWLREEHDLHISLQPESWVYPEEEAYLNGWGWSIFKGRPFDCLYGHIYVEKSYEEAAEKAIQYCLKNLIEKDGEISHESDRIKEIDETGTGL